MDREGRDPALQELLDKQAIREVVMRESRGVDRCNVDVAKSCYHPDARTRNGPFNGSSHEYAEITATRKLEGSDFSTHGIQNVLVDLDGETAYVETYFYGSEGRSRADKIWMSVGRYLDRFERRDGEWRIAARVSVLDWAGQVAVEWPEAGSRIDQYEHGGRGSDDLVFHMRDAGAGEKQGR